MERKVVSLVEEVNTVCLETERGLPSLTWHAFRDVPGIVPEEDVLHVPWSIASTCTALCRSFGVNGMVRTFSLES